MTKLAILAVAVASLPAAALAQNARSPAPAYCFDLTRVMDLAVRKERFASIAGRPRQGDFRDASLVLPDWKDCSLYGAATYTCDSAEMESAEAAAKARSTQWLNPATLSLGLQAARMVGKHRGLAAGAVGALALGWIVSQMMSPTEGEADTKEPAE